MLSAVSRYLSRSPDETRFHTTVRWVVTIVVGQLMLSTLLVIGGLVLLIWGMLFSGLPWLASWLGGIG